MLEKLRALEGVRKEQGQYGKEDVQRQRWKFSEVHCWEETVVRRESRKEVIRTSAVFIL